MSHQNESREELVQMLQGKMFIPSNPIVMPQAAYQAWRKADSEFSGRRAADRALAEELADKIIEAGWTKSEQE